MTRYLLGKLGEAVVAVWGVVTIVFFVTRLLGDPSHCCCRSAPRRSRCRR